MLITLPGFAIRDWRPEDAPSLARHADDRGIWLNLRDAFPSPYTLTDAASFLAFVARMAPITYFAIAVDDRAVGGIGYTLHGDVERVSAELGYWLGRAFWRRGIMTCAVRAMSAYAFRQHPELKRLFAVPYAWNPASMRVLEKAGYQLEGHMRQSAIKDGQVIDQALYSLLRHEALPGA